MLRRSVFRVVSCASITACLVSLPLVAQADQTSVSQALAQAAQAAAGASAPKPRPQPNPQAAQAFAELRKSLGARSAAIAFSPIDDDGPCTVFGDFVTGNAWSTVKVPISIAALRNKDTEQIRSWIVKAIRVSDNDAAASLFNSLGGRPQSQTKVEEVLREYGDDNTQVQRSSTQTDAEWRKYTTSWESALRGFGLSQWAIKDQCLFARGLLRDVSDEEFVTEQMGKITADHKWGLGIMASARFKGGWGPDAQGRYLVRQFGVVPLKGTRYAVAIATNPSSGTFSDGTKQLSTIVSWAAKNL